MDDDILHQMPLESRLHLVDELRALLEIDTERAEDLIRSAEPFWNAMEQAGGLVDAWGGGEFAVVLPRVLTFIRNGAWHEE